MNTYWGHTKCLKDTFESWQASLFVCCVPVCKQTIHSRNHLVQQHGKRPRGGVVSGGAGVLRHSSVHQSTCLSLRCSRLPVSLSAGWIDGELPAAPAPSDPAGHWRGRHQEPCDSAASQRPGGEEAGRARPYGPNAGDVQLHAGKQAGRSWVFINQILINRAVFNNSVVGQDCTSADQDFSSLNFDKD